MYPLNVVKDNFIFFSPEYRGIRNDNELYNYLNKREQKT